MSRKLSNASLLEVTGPQSLQLQNFRYFWYTVFQRLWIKSSRCHLHRWSSLALIKICSYLPFRKGVFSLFQYNFSFLLLSPLGEKRGLSFEETWIPSIQAGECQVWEKLAQWFWRKRFLSIFNIILLFRYYLPLEKGLAYHLNKL